MRRAGRTETRTSIGLKFSAAAAIGALCVVALSEGMRLIVPAGAVEVPGASPPKPAVPIQYPAPNTQGDCSVNGPNYGPFNPNCHNTYLGPPRRPDGLYQSDQLVGTVGSAHMDGQDKATLRIIHIVGLVDVYADFVIQHAMISCPSIAASMPHHLQGTQNVSIAMDQITCDIVGPAP